MRQRLLELLLVLLIWGLLIAFIIYDTPLLRGDFISGGIRYEEVHLD